MTKDKKNTDTIAIQAYNLCDGNFTVKEQKIYNGGDFVFTLQGNSYKIKIHFIQKDNNNDISLELKNNKIAFKILGQIQNNISIRGFHFISYNRVCMHIVGDKIISDDNEFNTHSITFVEHGFLLNKKDGDVHNIINFNNSKIEVSWIEFFSNGALKQILSVKSQKINAPYNGQMYYDLPIKENETICFTASGEIKDTCIDDSPERSAIVYNERLNKLEKSQEKTKQEVKELLENQEIATRGDRRFVVITCVIGFYFILNAFCLCFNKVGWWQFPLNFILPENFDKMCLEYRFSFFNTEHETFNKYTFFYEILKRIPIIISAILGFKFIKLAFERLRLIGEVEKVQKYLKLAQGDDVKNNLLGIIAVPFFTHKKQKQPLLDRLVDKICINIDKNNNGKSNNTEN